MILVFAANYGGYRNFIEDWKLDQKEYVYVSRYEDILGIARGTKIITLFACAEHLDWEAIREVIKIKHCVNIGNWIKQNA